MRTHSGFYGLINTGGIFSPAYMYEQRDPSRFTSSVNQFFASGLFDALSKTTDVAVQDCNIWTFTNDIPEMKAFEDTRTTEFDPLVLKCFTAQSDEEFDRCFQDVLDLCARKGINDETLARCTELMKTKFPDSWAAYVKGTN